MRLDETGYLRVVPADTAGDVRWGLEPLVAMVDRSARSVRHQFPDAITSVGHLSRQGGGEVDQHRSHESGRDVDVGFFIRSYSGHPLLPSHFVPFRADGTAPSWPGAYFDDARNWALVAAMLGDPEARITHIFVAAPLRARLLAYADRVGVPPALVVRAAEIMQQPRGALPHDDHFHVRIACPAHMNGCIENPPARNRRPETVLARGRRGATGTAGIASEPTVHATTHARNARSVEVPNEPQAPSAPAEVREPAAEPDTPPASLATPVDDVDG
jgi:penicillin-insensitive murein endopeptidase